MLHAFTSLATVHLRVAVREEDDGVQDAGQDAALQVAVDDRQECQPQQHVLGPRHLFTQHPNCVIQVALQQSTVFPHEQCSLNRPGRYKVDALTDQQRCIMHAWKSTATAGQPQLFFTGKCR